VRHRPGAEEPSEERERLDAGRGAARGPDGELDPVPQLRLGDAADGDVGADEQSQDDGEDDELTQVGRSALGDVHGES